MERGTLPWSNTSSPTRDWSGKNVVLITFLTAVRKCLRKASPPSYIREDSFCSHSDDIVRHGREGTEAGAWGSWPCGDCCQEAERDECWCSARFLLFIQTGTPSCGMTKHPSHPNNPNLETPSLTSQRLLFPVILGAVKLTVNINCYRCDVEQWQLEARWTKFSVHAEPRKCQAA